MTFVDDAYELKQAVFVEELGGELLFLHTGYGANKDRTESCAPV